MACLRLSAVAWALAALVGAGPPPQGTCDASGRCGGEAESEAAPLRCLAWRQTGSCSPQGQREPHGDKPCDTVIPSGTSGFCECEGGRLARSSTCDHRPFQCTATCLEAARYTCVGWRQTGDCSADGTREAGNDQACSAQIEPGSSGFCECGGGRMVKRPGCEKGQDFDPFSCSDECARAADLYEELDLDFAASDKQIKQAFRKMSLKYHPDKTRNDPAMTARFNAVREAYEVLSNPEHRAVYDIGGWRMLGDALQGKLEKGPSMNADFEVTLEIMYNGVEEMPRKAEHKVICRACRDSRSARCAKCTAGCANEVELVNVQMGPFVVQQQQEVASRERCRLEMAMLNVMVERGMDTGDTVVFAGMGEQIPKKMPGDISLTLKMTPHAVFTRTGNDLRMDVTISLKEAMLGFTRTIQHLDERRLEITFDTMTQPMQIIKVTGEGMPFVGDATTFGDLFIRCLYRMPTDDQLTVRHKEWLRENFPE